MSSSQRQTKGDYQARVHLDKRDLVVVRRRLDWVSIGQRKLMKKAKKSQKGPPGLSPLR
jgi:hypothetical protein